MTITRRWADDGGLFEPFAAAVGDHGQFEREALDVVGLLGEVRLRDQSGKYAFCVPVSLMRASMSCCIRPHRQQPYAVGSPSSRTGPLSASLALVMSVLGTSAESLPPGA